MVDFCSNQEGGYCILPHIIVCVGRKDTFLGRRGSFWSGKYGGGSHLGISYCCRLPMLILSFPIHFIINIVDVTVCFLITLLFLVNCSNLSLWCLALGQLAGLGKKGKLCVVLVGILYWRIPFPWQKAFIKSRQTTSTTFYTSTEQVTSHKRRPDWSRRTCLSQTTVDRARFPHWLSCAMWWHSGWSALWPHLGWRSHL